MKPLISLNIEHLAYLDNLTSSQVGDLMFVLKNYATGETRALAEYLNNSSPIVKTTFWAIKNCCKKSSSYWGKDESKGKKKVSEKQKAASRLNGKKGGRPPKNPKPIQVVLPSNAPAQSAPKIVEEKKLKPVHGLAPELDYRVILGESGYLQWVMHVMATYRYDDATMARILELFKDEATSRDWLSRGTNIRSTFITWLEKKRNGREHYQRKSRLAPKPGCGLKRRD